jgi:hypothetical protein
MVHRIARLPLFFLKTLLLVLGMGWATAPQLSQADQVIADDLIVQGSECVGLDCVNGESFSFDTIRLKENNLRIGFDDTSAIAGFPANDWQITANDSASGGANKFSIDDITGAKTPFTITAGAPSNSFFIDSSGRVGLRTATPVLDVHVNTGNTPAFRLEQNGSSGFTAQTWDIAGNEANFFIRDTTNGSKLPFRIQPNAPSNSLFIKGTDGNVGLGTTTPSAPLHVRRTDGDARLRIEEASATNASRFLMQLVNNGPISVDFTNTAAPNGTWRLTNVGATTASSFRISDTGDTVAEFNLDRSGNLTISGSLTTASSTVPDYVFKPDYPLMRLEEVESFVKKNNHLPNIPSAAEIQKDGINVTEMQMKLLEKVEELTLYTLQQEKTIQELQTRLATLEQQKTE